MKDAFFRAATVCALLLVPAVAEAAEGFATANVNMRSGPSTRYPAVTVIPAGDPVEIHGCLADLPWCDVSFYGGRGWVAGRYVQAIYRSRRVYLEPEYYRPLGIPTVVFHFDRYWDRNYRGRDFYRDRDRWRRGPDWADERDRRDWDRRRVSEDRREWERDREDGQWYGDARYEDRRRRERQMRDAERDGEMRVFPECGLDDPSCEND